ncbi:hypothetical protein HYV80_07595 [Candidatus Woesearchaeota archaeon]|nr:hypothetical protein [Candidatus Woesearchaeota archaeon]
MDRYNAFVSKVIEPGLVLLPTEAYLKKLVAEPGFPHESLGDFFSTVPLKGLASRIHDILKDKSEMPIDLVDVNSFNELLAKPDFTYIIDGKGQVRIYYPLHHAGVTDDAGFAYGIFSLAFLPELFAKAPKGSLQEFLRQHRERWSNHGKMLYGHQDLPEIN